MGRRAVARLRLRDFRCYAAAERRAGPAADRDPRPNGAGKTNLVEALFFGCTASSCRTANERELVRFGAPAARVELDADDEDGDARARGGLRAGRAEAHDGRRRAGRAPGDVPASPLVCVFLPDRLELVKGTPALRRAISTS